MAGDLSLVVKWAGKDYHIEINDTKTVFDLKRILHERTKVKPERQKLLNLKHKGKTPADEIQLSAMQIKSGSKIMMMGSLEADIADATIPPEDLPEVLNDFDIDEVEVATENREDYLAKVGKRVKEYTLNYINEPREGKKLLVLDIDYTLFDHRSTGQTGNDLMRPFLHEFLASAYEDYDIVIWSATSMKWIEEKMKVLGVITNPNYKIMCYVDYLAMISIYLPKYGVVDVKPLGVLWGKLDRYSSKNTIMFDDIRRNFLMNPQNGLRIRAFRDAHANRSTDRELLKLMQYLKAIAPLDDLSELNHKHWEKYLSKRGGDTT